MRSFEAIKEAIRFFDGDPGPMLGTDPSTDQIRRIVKLEEVSDPKTWGRLAVVYEDGERRVFAAQEINPDYDSGTGRSYLNLRIKGPDIPGCVPDRIEISGGQEYDQCDGRGSYGPHVELIIVSKDAEARNASAIAVHEAERRRVMEEESRRREKERIRLETERRRHLEARMSEISGLLAGKRVRAVNVEAHQAEFITELELKLDDGTSVKIRARHDHALEIEQE